MLSQGHVLQGSVSPQAVAELGVAADAVLRLGLLLMGAGTSGYRVMRAMKRAARALGFDRLDVVVTVNTITATFHQGEAFRTVVANHHHPTVDASRIEALEDLSHRFTRRITADELMAWLDDIEHAVRSRWSRWGLALAAGVACWGFALLNHYPLREALIAGMAAMCGQFLRHFLLSRHLNALGVVGISGCCAAGVYAALMAAAGLNTGAAGFVAAVLFLIPGFPLFSALLDLARFDILAGTTRLVYALALTTSATLSVSLVGGLVGMQPITASSSVLPWWVAAGASFCGIAGFGFLFNSSRRMVLIAAHIGTAANLLRLYAISFGMPRHVAALIGGLIIGVLAALIVRRVRLPRITMTVPAAVIMVPGAAMYQAVYNLNRGDIDGALSESATAALIVVCIAAGLGLARMLTDKDWAFGNLINFDKPLDAPAVPPVAAGTPPLPQRGSHY